MGDEWRLLEIMIMFMRGNNCVFVEEAEGERKFIQYV